MDRIIIKFRLFYLMVLATSHTISKSIARTESLEDAYDTFNDIDITKKHNLKHGRIHSNRHERCFDKVRNEEVLNETTEKGKTIKLKIKKHGKTTDNRKLQRVWRKNHSKKETKKITQPEILVEQWQETPFAQLFENVRSSKIYNNVLDYIGSTTTNRLKNVKETTMKKHEKRTWMKRNKKAKIPVEYNLEKPPVKFKRNTRKEYATHRTKTERPGYDKYKSNITQILSAMSTKLEELKDLYSTSDYTTVTSSTEAVNAEEENIEDIIQNEQNSEPIHESDTKYGGTDTLEALLSDVKSKAIEMIASHPPAITNLITNAVTETTYSVDPILTHDNDNPLFFLSTLATMNEELTNQVTDKPIIPGITRDDNFGYFQYRTEPTRKVRDLGEEGYTILMTWHDFHDKMQKKLKEMYHTVKCDVGKKVNATKKVLKQTTKKITKKITSCPKLKTEQTVNTKPKLVKEMSNSSNWKPYSYLPYFKGHQTVRRKKQQTASIVPALEYDDYSLLSLYERMLSKTHESNLMKFLATESYPTMKRKIRQTEPVLELENNGDSGNVYESTTIDDDSNTVSSIGDTSYEGLSKKIAYNDFVNGFKHYLNFERDMSHSNFSNLIRYQAHRHHDVEEIGKYILDKIPQIPILQDRDKRAFFDYYDDDQDVSTKSDDSWFKRHFYYFVERSGTPKKYHTSQTVALKNPLEENENIEPQQPTEFVRNHVEFRVNNPSHEKAGSRLGWNTAMPFETNMSLEQLSFWLTGYSSTITSTPASTSTLSMTHEDHDNLLAFKNSLHSPHLLDKFLIGIGRVSKKTTLKQNDFQTGDDGEFRRKREDDKIPEKKDRHEQKENTKATVPMKLYTKSSDSKSNKKLKVVNVNVAPATQHEGKRKFNWFRKLKFHKKKSNRTKRESERQPRFNIMKKIKHLFDAHTDAPIDDYDLTRTKLKAFKPVKYDSPLSLDDMKLQVPDVSDNDKFSIKVVPERDKMGVTQQMSNIEHNYMDRKFYKTTTPKVTTKATSATKYQNKIEEYNNEDNTGATKYQNKIGVIKNKDKTGATKYQNKIEEIKNEIDTIALKISKPTIADRIMSKQPITYDFKNTYAMQNEKNAKKLHDQVNPKTNIIILTSSDEIHDYKTETADAVALRKYPSTKSMKILYSHLNNGDYDNRDTLIDVPETEVVSYSEYQNFEGNKVGHTNTKFNLVSELPFTVPVKPDVLINLGGSKKTTYTRKATTYDHFNDFMIWNSDILHSDKYGENIKIITEPASPTTESRDMQAEFFDFVSKKPSHEIFNLRLEPDVKLGKSARPRNTFLEVTPKMNIMKMKREKRTSKDFVKKLHRLHTFRKMKNSKRKFYPRELNTLMADTSLFAYDDGLDYFTDSYKEIAKHSVSDSAMGNISAPIKITPPHQYYTTPLPMMKDEFEHFLKENDLDVKSLTTSLPDTSDLDKLLYSDRKQTTKLKSGKLSSNNINENKQHSKAVSEEHTTKKSKVKNKNHVRVKDSNNILKDIFDENPEDDQMAGLDFKFHTITPDITTKAFHEKPYQQENIEVTFINVDDDKEALPNFDLSNDNGQSQIKNYATKDESTAITMNTEYTTKRNKQNKVKDAVTTKKPTKKFKVEHHRTQSRHWTDFLHNNLIYNNVFKQKMNKATGSTPMKPETTIKHSSKMKENSTLVTTVPETTLESTTFDHFKIFQNLPKHKKPPKRVQIKSHSFKYDVVYDDGISNQLGFDSTKSENEPTFKIDQLFKKPVTEKKLKDRGNSWNRLQKTNHITVPPKYFNFDGNLAEESRRNKRCKWFPCGRCKNCTKVTKKCSTTEVTKTLKMKTKKKGRPKRRDNSKFKGYEQNIEKYQMTTKLSSNFFSNLLRPFTIPTTVNEVPEKVESADYKLQQKDVIGYQEPKLMDSCRKIAKRHSESHIAKDVAALEVIVDMVKNSIDDDGTTDTTSANFEYPTSGSSATNAIQVHISLPKYLDNYTKGKRYPERVRKVFTAKLNTPVDLEYQIHSFDDTPFISTSTEMTENIPAMFLIVESSNASIPRGNFLLKPILRNASLPNLKTRQVDTFKEIARTEKMTTAPTSKLSKVTLSKDFISAMNKHLVQLYDSLIANETGHKAGVRGLNKTRVRRAINWKKIKGHFSNDRVCNCKCLPNKTMCRVCAASDAVMNELIFEINNIVQYMTDHCTEIQTYFYMNPSGGRKLRDAVKKVDKSLDDYYKRVKGKCKGKTCDAYRFIDKREIVGYSNDIEKKLSHKIKQFEKDIHNAAKLRVCPNDKLKQKCLKLGEVVKKCTNGSRIKRSKVNETSKQKDKPIKTVYSVDNVNVNIICNTDTTESFTTSNKFETQSLDYHAYAVSRETKRRWHLKDLFHRKHKHDNLLSFYTVENEKSTERVRFKRKDAGSIETPLNTDTGGAFWSDYVNKIHTEQFVTVRQTSEPITENVTNNTERNVTARNIKSNNMTFLPNLITTHKATENSKLTDATTFSAVTENTEATEQTINESLHGSVNDLFKLLRSSYVKDMNENDSPVETFVTVTDSTNAVTTLRSHHSHHHKKTKKKKKNKCKCKENCTCKEKTSEAKSSTQKSKSHSTKNHKPVTTALPKKSSDKKDKKTTRTPEYINSNWLTTEAAAFTNTLDEVTSANVDFVNSESSVNFVVEETTKSKEHQRQIAKLLKIFGSKRSANNTQQINEKKVTNSTSTHLVSQPISEQEVTIISSPSAVMDFPPISEQYTTIRDSSSTHVESQATTEEYPTILILNDVDNTHLMVLESDLNIANATETNLTKSAQSDSYKSLLLSILKYKTKALKREWQKVIGGDRVKLAAQEDEDMMEKDRNFINLRIKIVNHTEPKKDDAESSRVNRDYDILAPLRNLELKPPKRIEEAGAINRFFSKFSVKTKDPCKATKVIKGGNELKTTRTTASSTITRVNSKHTKSTATKSATRSGKGSELTDSITTRKTCETPRRLCDMENTFTHILISSRHMNKRYFQSFVKNITCHKYRKAPDYFYIRPKVSKRNEDHLAKNKDNRIRRDWIRSKRSLHVDDEIKNNFYNKENEYETLDDIEDTKKGTEVLKLFATSDDNREIRNDVDKLEVNSNTRKALLDDEDDKFEKLYRDRNGIYRIIEAKRKKRTVNGIEALSRNMKNLPPIRVPKNEIYAVLGDTVTIPCYNSKGGPYSWRKDRDSFQNQVEVEGPYFVIKRVTAKDAGTYSCLKDNSLINSTKLSIVCVPTFHVVFQPLYESSRHCTVHDLKATLRLGDLMAAAACPGGSCYITIDRPACSRDVADNSSLITMTGTIRSVRRGVKCSVECRRDLQCGLALLSAGNARVLSSVDVIIPRQDDNVTLTPTTGRGRKLVITKTLNSGLRLDEAPTTLSPGVVDVMMSCPAGFFLVSGLKICVAIPPPAAKLEPKRYRRLHKYDWWRYSYFLVASCVVLGAICAGADALAARMSERRGSETTRVAFHTVSESPRLGARARRRISPSRVILPRLFRHASSRLSQETKTSHKKKHTPPPVPSIDFDS